MKPKDIAAIVSFGYAIGHPNRVRLMDLLNGMSELSVTALCHFLKLPQPTVSHHLGLLRRAGFVATRRDGKQIIYSLTGKAESCVYLAEDAFTLVDPGPL